MREVRLTILEAGVCHQLEHLVLRTGRPRMLRFPAMFAVIEHPTAGVILFDTGYSRHLFEQTTRWPERLYTLLLPVALSAEDEATAQLARMGIGVEDVGHIFLSHFHVDHVSALAAFPRATIIHSREAWEAVRGLGRWEGLTRAFMAGLIPSDFDARARPFGVESMEPLGAEYAPFARGFDVLGDGTLVAVELPGHAAGQVGLFVRAQGVGEVFLIADACWTSRSYRENRLPHRIAALIFDDWGQYADSLTKIHHFHRRRPEVPIVPSHCEEAITAIRAYLLRKKSF